MESVFDPLKFYEELKAADVQDKQARAQAEAMRSAFTAYDAIRLKEFATKGDLRELELRFENKIENSKHEILKRMIGAMIGQTAMLIAIFAYFKQ